MASAVFGKSAQKQQGLDKIMSLLKRIGLGRLSGKLTQLQQALDHQTDVTNRRSEETNRRSEEIAEKIEKLSQLHQDLDRQNRKLGEVAQKIDELAQDLPRSADPASLLGERTHNAFHPDYEKKLVRASPGKIFNRDKPSTNPAFVELLKQANGDEVADGAWGRILAEALVEATSVPGAAQVFERQAFVENYLSGLAREFRARYAAGWVDLDDALFLYWLVRQTKPRRIVQCGAFNGRSSAFMMLALAKNGPDGTLKIIDQPPIFDAENPEWTVAGKVYGAVVPAGKTSAWMVPDQYRDRMEIRNGRVNELLPKLVDGLDGIDLFCHGSDHTYQHMMSAFEEVKRKLRPGGLVVAIDVGWNASLWDFAERHGVPSYTFKAAVGVGFF
jgi:predicted O-methyltransferase YrrM